MERNTTVQPLSTLDKARLGMGGLVVGGGVGALLAEAVEYQSPASYAVIGSVLLAELQILPVLDRIRIANPLEAIARRRSTSN